MNDFELTIEALDEITGGGPVTAKIDHGIEIDPVGVVDNLYDKLYDKLVDPRR